MNMGGQTKYPVSGLSAAVARLPTTHHSLLMHLIIKMPCAFTPASLRAGGYWHRVSSRRWLLAAGCLLLSLGVSECVLCFEAGVVGCMPGAIWRHGRPSSRAGERGPGTSKQALRLGDGRRGKNGSLVLAVVVEKFSSSCSNILHRHVPSSSSPSLLVEAAKLEINRNNNGSLASPLDRWPQPNLPTDDDDNKGL
jgi:hypothetical protein